MAPTPKDNPFLADPLVPPDVFAFGVRDPEGAAINPRTGELWEVEHGPAGGDELNIIRSGRDYGWPVISYGLQYTTGKAGGLGRHGHGRAWSSRCTTGSPTSPLRE